MKQIKYIRISNFKVFGEEIAVNFDNMTVLIGPNNAGKTTIIQALALWHLGIANFYNAKTEDKNGIRKAKGKLETRTGIGINRRDIETVPHTDTRQLFHNSRVRTGVDNEKITITVGLLYKDETIDCTVIFKYFKSELVYCYLGESLAQNIDLLVQAASLNIHLLYPMSGLEREETVLQEGAIRKQIGRGITAGLLRNICYNLYSNDAENWEELNQWMEQLFYIKLETPKQSSYNDLILEYNYVDKRLKTEKPLDILQAGRGQLQMLLMLSFIMWKKNAIILIDEPDAHLEVLRQSQVLEVLKKITDKYNSQIIIASHSEVIMNEAESLTFILNGKNIDIDEQEKQKIKSSLKDFGIEQYYKAELTKSVLYLEGTTDKQNLIAIAQQLNHQAAKLLQDRVFIYYTQSPDEQHEEYAMRKGYYEARHEKHFQALAVPIKDLKGLAIFDNDNKNKPDKENKGLITQYWKQYELENYFLNPGSILKFVQHYFNPNGEINLFDTPHYEQFKHILETHFLKKIFDNNPVLLDLYINGSIEQQKALYQSNSANKKTSELLENTFRIFAENGNELILRKGEFYKIAPFLNIDDIDKEVIEKLDKICEILA
jgi:predicted ATPase